MAEGVVGPGLDLRGCFQGIHSFAQRIPGDDRTGFELGLVETGNQGDGHGVPEAWEPIRQKAVQLGSELFDLLDDRLGVKEGFGCEDHGALSDLLHVSLAPSW